MQFTEDFAEKIAKISYSHFNNLPKTGKPKLSEWTILSTIVKQDSDKNTLEIVALGTGSKCIGVNSMSVKGDILNDSHAEIICRRACIRYLLEEIKHSVISTSDVFVFDKVINKCILKDNISFHMFTSQVPCGDAAIFSRNSSEDVGECVESKIVDIKKEGNNTLYIPPSKRFKSEEKDIYITGAKCLHQKDLQCLKSRYEKCHVLGLVRTKPGRGSPTLSVSCSDKIAKWCHLGFQGALISLLIKEPLFLKSFIVAGGTPFNREALFRAFYERFLDNIEDRTRSRMEIQQALTVFNFYKTEDKIPCPNSIIWSKVKTRSLEVSVDGKRQGVTKSKRETKAARLQICKMEIFRLFTDLIMHNNFGLNICNIKQLTYLETKLLADTYQKKWKQLRQYGFKEWTYKDPKLQEFVLD